MVAEYLNSLYAMVCQMAPYLLLGFLFAGLLHAFVPRQTYARHLSGNGWGAAIKAALIGIPLPLCSCGVIPTTVGLRKSGASEAASTSFLISTPQTGIDSIIATYSLLGLPFAIVRPIVALVTAVAGGKLVGLFGNRKSATDIAANDDNDCGCNEHTHSHGIGSQVSSFISRIVEALRYGFIEMVQDVGKWLVIGLLIAAAITVLVPDNFFASFADRPLLNMAVVLIIAAPMYICATGSIPIALSLMLKGMSPGAALVLLMAGPATNVASILVIGKVFGRRSLLLYLLTIIAGAILGGMVIDYLLPTEWFTGYMAMAQNCCHVDCCVTCDPSWLGIISTIALVAMLIGGFVAKRIESNRNKKRQQTTTNMKREYKIGGMMCGHCKANVERNIATVAGVKAVTVDLPGGIAYVEGEHNADDIIAMVISLGYTCQLQQP